MSEELKAKIVATVATELRQVFERQLDTGATLPQIEQSFLEIFEVFVRTKQNIELFIRHQNIFREYVDDLSESELTTWNSGLNSFLGSTNEMIEFVRVRLPEPPDQEKRQKIVTKFQKLIEEFVHPVIQKAYRELKPITMMYQMGGQVEKAIAEDKRERQENLKEISAIETEKAIVAGEMGEEGLENYFYNEAKENLKEAKRWRRWIPFIVGTLFIVALVISTLSIIFGSFDYREALVLKLSLTPLGFFSLFFISKNYNAHMHLAKSDMHRANILKTILAFRRIVDDRDIQNSAFSNATSILFELRETGYTSSSRQTN